MSWQNQAGQQFPSQAMPPFPGQIRQSVAGVPGYTGATQLQQQAEPQIPPEANAVAQAAGLGTLNREFRKSVGGKIRGTSGANIGMIIGGVSILGSLLVVLLVVPFPFNLIGVAATLLMLLPFLPMMLRITKIFNGGSSGNSAFRAWSSEHGLVYTQNGRMNAVRWSDIQQVWRKIGMVNGVMTVIGYMAQPANAPGFEFNLLGGPYAGLLNAFGGNNAMSISSGAGEMSNYGGFTQISGMVDLSAYAGLGDLLEEQVLKHLLPRALETYHAGGTLSFGKFMIRQQGLNDSTRELGWSEIDRIQISVPVIQIMKKPASMVWFNLSATDTPNMALLAAVLNTIR